jgi:D-alanyl-lipoteichoic acid acyltransferase DltB (MBOAT superfamily)
MSLDYLNPFVLFPVIGLLAVIFYVLPRQVRWIFLLLISYAFYYTVGSWTILVLILVTTTNYFLGLGLGTERISRKQLLLVFGIAFNVIILFLFKYLSSLLAPDSSLITFLSSGTGSLLVPAGLSFYTLQNISYLVDVSKGLIKPERNPGIFALYLAFFPKILSGPIERGKKFIPQVKNLSKLDWDNITAGLQLMLFGLFKKVVIADRLALFVNEVFNKPGTYYGWTVIIALIFLSFQIYLDFSGYTDLALGIARVFGIHLTPNFKRPYFSENIVEFWNRWHLTFSTWLRDYIFYPLRRYLLKSGFKSIGVVALIIPPLITMVLSGIWHGVGVTFIIWGLYHAFFYTLVVWWKSRHAVNAKKPLLIKIVLILLNFVVLTLSWLIFRSENLQDTFTFFQSIVVPGQMQYNLNEVLLHTYIFDFQISRIAILLIVAVEVFLEIKNDSFKLEKSPVWLRWSVYLIVILSLTALGLYQGSDNPFVYFKF